MRAGLTAIKAKPEGAPTMKFPTPPNEEFDHD